MLFSVLMCTEMVATNTFSVDVCLSLSAILEAMVVFWESISVLVDEVHTLSFFASNCLGRKLPGYSDDY